MSDYLWQHTAPIEQHIDYIYQVQYMIHPIDAALFQVKQTNLHDQVTQHCAYLLIVYQDHLRWFLWRGAILMRLYLKYHKRAPKNIKSFITRLGKILVHIDNTIGSLLHPAVGLSVNEAEEYRSKSFEEYLIIKFLLGRYDPTIMQEYRETYDINIERMSLEDFGMFAFLKLSVLTNEFPAQTGMRTSGPASLQCLKGTTTGMM